MESWESPLHSLTNSIQTNLRLLEQQRVKEKDSQTDYGMKKAELPNPLYWEKESTSVCLSNAKCSGIMGVPITFLDKYNPDQFEILGMAASAGYNKEIVGLDFLGNKDARPLINGKNTYARVFIRRRKQ